MPMATKTTLSKKEKTVIVKGGSTATNGGTTPSATKTTTTRTSSNVYDDSVKEIVALSENDAYGRKVDAGPLSEARGKDTWHLHTLLRSVDAVNQNIESDIKSTRQAVQGWIGNTTEELNGAIKTAQSSITKNVKDSATELDGRIESLTNTVKDSFAKLAKATAGTEENLRGQTEAFSKEVDHLLATLRGEIDAKVTRFHEESTRLVDRRFNNSDVAFAAIRADQEVIKALLTDIIKDRLGRPEPKSR